MGSSVSSITRADVDRESGRGHSYSEISITGNARAHNGDVYKIRNFYGSWPEALSRESQQGAAWNVVKVPGKRKRAASDLSDMPSRGDNPFLALAISQLGDFSTSLRHQKQDDAAQRVVSWIRVIIDGIEVSGTASQAAHTPEELAKIQQSLLVTNRVGINPMDRRKIPEQVVRVKRKSSLIVFETWKIALDTVSWNALDERAQKVTGSSSALRLQPLDLTSASPIAAFFGERTDHLQTSVIHPTILAYRYVGSFAEVFDLVVIDDVTGLTKLFAEQKATTRDLDNGGRSLLHYACENGTTACCAFLIEHGADIDGVATTLGPEHLSQTAGTPLSFASAIWPHSQCTTLLLEAGADPTIPDSGTESEGPRSPLLSALTDAFLNSPISLGRGSWGRGVQENWEYAFKRMISDNHAYLAAATSGSGSYSQGASIWLSAFLYDYPPSINIVRCLLDAGCDFNEAAVNHRDVPDGWNCIFLQVLRAQHPTSSLELETLQYTLKQGGDIFAKDASGLTVFDHVNALSPGENFSGYRRDLWYCALQREGIDTGSTIEANPVAECSFWYNLDHFRALRHLDTWAPNDVSQKVHEALTAHDVAYPDTKEATLRLSELRSEKEEEQRWERKRREESRERRRKNKEWSDAHDSLDDELPAYRYPSDLDLVSDLNRSVCSGDFTDCT